MRPELPLSAELEVLFADNTKPPNLSTVMESAAERAYGFAFVVVSLPIALPATPPGMSTPFGLVVVALALQLLLGRSVPWVPSKLAQRELRLDPTGKFFKNMLRCLKWFEGFSRPRYIFFYRPAWLPLHGLMACLAGLVMSTSLPFFNSLFALSVLLIGLGLIEDDGLMGGLGWLLCVLLLLAMGFLISLSIFGVNLLNF